MQNRGILRKQVGVWVRLGGGMVLACRLLECSNPFDSTDDAPETCST